MNDNKYPWIGGVLIALQSLPILFSVEYFDRNFYRIFNNSNIVISLLFATSLAIVMPQETPCHLPFVMLMSKIFIHYYFLVNILFSSSFSFANFSCLAFCSDVFSHYFCMCVRVHRRKLCVSSMVIWRSSCMCVAMWMVMLMLIQIDQ